MFGNIDHGSLTVGTSAVQILSNVTENLNSVLVYIIPNPANTANVFIGNSDVTAGTAAPTTDGVCLSPASPPLIMPITDPKTLYARSTAADQNISFIIIK